MTEPTRREQQAYDAGERYGVAKERERQRKSIEAACTSKTLFGPEWVAAYIRETSAGRDTTTAERVLLAILKGDDR